MLKYDTVIAPWCRGENNTAPCNVQLVLQTNFEYQFPIEIWLFFYWENYCHVHYYTHPKQTQHFKANTKSDIRFDQAAFIKFLSKKNKKLPNQKNRSHKIL